MGSGLARAPIQTGPEILLVQSSRAAGRSQFARHASGTLLHNPYQDLSHHAAKMIKYARWGALELHASGRRATPVDLAIRPAWRFVRDYLFYGSFLDGRYGLTTSTLTAYSAFLKYAFLYELGNSDVPQGGPDSAGDKISG